MNQKYKKTLFVMREVHLSFRIVKLFWLQAVSETETIKHLQLYTQECVTIPMAPYFYLTPLL